MKVIIGLGNPGDKYKNTRHNLGFMVLDALSESLDKVSWEKSAKFQAEIQKINDDLLVKPQTFMNSSGQAVAKIMSFYKVSPHDLVVVYDELDLPLGKIKISQGGGAAGHHGVESIIASLGSEDFIRVRLGIAEEAKTLKPEVFVLEPFAKTEESAVKAMITRGQDALKEILKSGLALSQNQYNQTS